MEGGAGVRRGKGEGKGMSEREKEKVLAVKGTVEGWMEL